MTARQVYEYVLIEINKVETTTLLLEDFNYLINKAIYQFANKTYNIYDLNQQSTDKLRVLKAPTAKLTPTIIMSGNSKLYGDFYEVELPSDYFHILNCVCEFLPLADHKCFKENEPVYSSARKLTSDMWPQSINNYYFKPSQKTPYYFFNNSAESISTSPLPVRVEIRYGKSTNFKLNKVYIDYLKVPQNILLTTDQIDMITDISQKLEFPDYVCYEIINELAKLILEQSSDPRLQSHIPVNQSIATPTQLQAQQQ